MVGVPDEQRYGLASDATGIFHTGILHLGKYTYKERERKRHI
jgi:hypothetical protein